MQCVTSREVKSYAGLPLALQQKVWKKLGLLVPKSRAKSRVISEKKWENVISTRALDMISNA